MNNSLRFFFLGRFRLESDAGPIRLPTRKAEALLAYLSLHPAPHGREKLLGLFWGDSPARQARTSLRVALTALRSRLGPDLFITEHDTVQCHPSAGLWVDALEFETRARRFLSGSAAELSLADVELYQGDLLPDFDHDWIGPLREHYRALYLDVLLRLSTLWRARSEYGRAAGYARRVLDADNLNEQSYRDLMVCYAAQGERQAALKQYTICRDILRDELGVEPSPATAALYEWIKRTAPATDAHSAALTNLPVPLTSFVGRVRELAEARQAFSGTRLLTLTGPGGSGKTRLAVQLAVELAGGFRDGAWWVELATVSDPFLVPRLVAKAVGVRAEPVQGLAGELAAYLRPRELLLVLDNCEHLAPACAVLAVQLLVACPKLKILTTSREVLGVGGEAAWRVPPLPLPEPSARLTAADLARFEGLRLFVERALAIRPHLVFDEQNVAAVAEVCRRLDGLPLAIELAAARVNVLSIQQIAARLDDRFRLLTTSTRGPLPRQQTLWEAVDWSYQLLSETERSLFRRLSVFVGGCSLAAAQQVAGYGLEVHDVAEDILTGLSRLAGKSLILVSTATDQARYGQLETIREFGLEQLRTAGELEAARQRHFDWCLALAQMAAPHLSGAEQARWYDRLEAELDNLRAALEWSLGAKDNAPFNAGVRLAALLGQFWYVRGNFSEGRRWLKRAQPAGDTAASSDQADALYWQGFLAWMQADYGVARELFEQSKAVSAALADDKGIARALQNEGLVLARMGDYATARALLGQSLSLQRQIGDQPGSLVSLFAAGRVAWFQEDLASAHALLDQGLAIARSTGNTFLSSLALSSLGDVAWSEGNYPLARAHLEACLAMFRSLGNRQNTATALLSLGYVFLAQGQWPMAQSHYAESLAIYAQLGDKWGIANALQGMGCLAGAEGAPERAARLLGAGEHLRLALGAPLPIFQSAYHQYSAAVQLTLGPAAFASARAAGARLHLEQAVDLALIGAPAAPATL